jgi:hypothetical protein
VGKNSHRVKIIIYLPKSAEIPKIFVAYLPHALQVKGLHLDKDIT